MRARATRRGFTLRGFTLIELLIVVAIIGVLATMLLSAIFGAKSKTQVAVAKSQIKTIQAALSMYEGDHGKLPRRWARPTTTLGANDVAWNDDSPSLYMALRNRPTQALGGGQGSPYVDWKPDAIGTIGNGANDGLYVSKMGQDGSNPIDIQLIPPNDYEKLSTPAYQLPFTWGAGATPAPSANRLLVLLDPWQNQYHYREWASVRASIKDAYLAATPTGSRTLVAVPADRRQGQMIVPSPVLDTIHQPDAYDIWSNGPNGVNEFGAAGSDDVTSWN